MNDFNPEIYQGNIITTRVRLARNLVDYPFIVTDELLSKQIVKKVNRAVVKCDTFKLFYTSNLSAITLEAMKERHLISQSLIDNKKCGACLINNDESVSIMICEEDVIREQCFMKGLRLKESYDRISNIDDELSKNLNLAFDKKLGFLTACPTNVGTGLRASVMMFLPALSISNQMQSLCNEVAKYGLTIRGLYGEGSGAEGYLYQVSNEVTLGVTEYDIIKRVEDAVKQICREERRLSENIYGRHELKTMDKARKSYGILTNAVMLSYEEFLGLIAQVKLGAMLGMINITEIDKIDDLIVAVRPANLCEQYGKKMNEIDRDLFRAEMVKAKLHKLID